MIQKYLSDLELGEKYKDSTTDIEGTLVSLHFYEHACERGTLRFVDGNGRVVESSFDAPELIHIATNEKICSDKPGGPQRAEGVRSVPIR